MTSLPGTGPAPVGLNDLMTAAQNLVRAVNSLNSLLSKIESNGSVTLPQGSIAGSAGAPTGTYLVITAPDGNQYKIELFALV